MDTARTMFPIGSNISTKREELKHAPDVYEFGIDNDNL